MNWLSLALGLMPGIVHGLEAIVGDKADGKTKKQMAKDALAVAGSTAAGVLTGSNAVYADAASKVVGLVIDQTVAVAKANGTYQKATAIAAAAQQDVEVAKAVTLLVQSVQVPTTPAPSALQQQNSGGDAVAPAKP